MTRVDKTFWAIHFTMQIWSIVIWINETKTTLIWTILRASTIRWSILMFVQIVFKNDEISHSRLKIFFWITNEFKRVKITQFWILQWAKKFATITFVKFLSSFKFANRLKWTKNLNSKNRVVFREWMKMISTTSFLKKIKLIIMIFCWASFFVKIRINKTKTSKIANEFSLLKSCNKFWVKKSSRNSTFRFSHSRRSIRIFVLDQRNNDHHHSGTRCYDRRRSQTSKWFQKHDEHFEHVRNVIDWREILDEWVTSRNENEDWCIDAKKNELFDAK